MRDELSAAQRGRRLGQHVDDAQRLGLHRGKMATLYLLPCCDAPALTAEPALKPNHPNQSSAAPSTTMGTLWGRSIWGFQRPPSHVVRTSAETPEET
jgi:hypothetical protein